MFDIRSLSNHSAKSSQKNKKCRVCNTDEKLRSLSWAVRFGPCSVRVGLKSGMARYRNSAPILILLSILQLQAQKRPITLEEIYHPDKQVSLGRGRPIGLRWFKDGDHYLERVSNGTSPLVRVHAETGEKKPLFESEKLRQAFLRSGVKPEQVPKSLDGLNYILSPDEQGVLFYHEDDLYYFHFSLGNVTRLTSTVGEEEVAELSPDASRVAFVRGNNLYAAETKNGKERRLTADGTPEVLNGLLDWVYQEEVYGRGNFRAFWWSPDSTMLAFLQLDESRVPVFAIPHEAEIQRTVEQTRYPRPGEPNPGVKLGIVKVSGGPVSWVDTGRYKPDDMLIVRVSWTPDSKAVIFQVQNREQTWLDLIRHDVSTGRVRSLLREESKAWVDILGQPVWLEDGSFLWRSDRTGWTHLYHCNADGKVIRPVTSGDWRVGRFYGVDPKGEFAYFAANKDSFPDTQIYRVAIKSGEVHRITGQRGSHSADFNPVYSRFIDTWNDVQTPTAVYLVSARDGKVLRTISEPNSKNLEPFEFSKPEFLQIKTKDGFPLEAMMIRPHKFDPKRRYPVFMPVYGGPLSPTIRNGWGSRTYLWHQFLAQNGILVLAVDSRSAGGKGAQFAWPAHRNLGELELRDLEEVVDWLKGQTHADTDRIAISGWSFGGYLTCFALTHSKSFKLGLAGGPVTDWRLYDSIYTERYMGLPENNREGYDRSSVLKAAANLHGRLLLMHGLIDDNVHVQNSVQLVFELQKAGKQFDLMFYPDSRHGVTIPALNWHLRQLMTRFLLENL